LQGDAFVKNLLVSVAALCTAHAGLHLDLAAALDQQPDKKDQKTEVIGTIERLDPRFDMLVPKDAQLEKIAEGFIWTEGAVWLKSQKCLLFSDIPNNVVIRWKEGEGTSEFLKPSGYTGAKPRGGKAGDEPGSNGLHIDPQGRLNLCEHGDRRVTRIEKDGKTKTVLADSYMGKRLNSPNDLAIHPNGDVYFTDPPYGMDKGTKSELGFNGVFRIRAKDGMLSLVSKNLQPNGIALSPDAKKLYVTNGTAWMVFPVNEDGSTGEGKVFVDTKTWAKPLPKGGLDGVKCDAQGNLFATVSGGFCVIAADGTLLGWFKTGDRTANLCFGGEDGQTLFVCVNHRIGRVRLATKGMGW
jgi:gluconolactonase